MTTNQEKLGAQYTGTDPLTDTVPPNIGDRESDIRSTASNGERMQQSAELVRRYRLILGNLGIKLEERGAGLLGVENAADFRKLMSNRREMTNEEAGRLAMVTKICALLKDTIPSDQQEAWMSKTNRDFGDKSPLDAMMTKEGTDRVRDYLRQLKARRSKRPNK